MSSDVAVALENLSKCYQTYRKPLHRIIQAFLGQRRKLYSEFWALKGVDLAVEKGETIGILGKNGSGKSTLLQIIAGTLTPTGGRVEVNGRVSALLELGAGFNPEFTGAENAKLNAAIMGVPADEIEERLPSIVEFSELGNFINQPVKTYSSGMYVRLAFSVAINMQPEILIIDEALAVGDVKFQRKCFRMLEQMRNQGVSILFVTHATGSILAHCDRALFLDDGQVRVLGEPKTVVNRYLESLFQHEVPTGHDAGDGPGGPVPADSEGLATHAIADMCPRRDSYNYAEYRWGDRRAEIVDYILLDEAGEQSCSVFNQGDVLQVRMVIHSSQVISRPVFGLTLKTVDGAAVYGTNTLMQEVEVPPLNAGSHTMVVFTLRVNLLAGEYFGSLGVVTVETGSPETVHDRRYDLFQLRVEDRGDAFGLAALDGEVRLEPL